MIFQPSAVHTCECSRALCQRTSRALKRRTPTFLIPLRVTLGPLSRALQTIWVSRFLAWARGDPGSPGRAPQNYPWAFPEPPGTSWRPPGSYNKPNQNKPTQNKTQQNDPINKQPTASLPSPYSSTSVSPTKWSYRYFGFGWVWAGC